MILVKQDIATHLWGYEIVEEMEGSAHLGFRVLDSSFEGFDGPGSVYAMVTSLQKAFMERKYKIGRSPETGLQGYQVYEFNAEGKPTILSESFGWENGEEVKQHLIDITTALRGETKMVQAPALPPKKSSKTLDMKLPPGFIVDEDE